MQCGAKACREEKSTRGERRAVDGSVAGQWSSGEAYKEEEEVSMSAEITFQHIPPGYGHTQPVLLMHFVAEIREFEASM